MGSFRRLGAERRDLDWESGECRQRSFCELSRSQTERQVQRWTQKRLEHFPNKLGYYKGEKDKARDRRPCVLGRVFGLVTGVCF